jgi:hypothetical protein
MDLAWISLAALLVVIVCSCTTPINPGLLALSFAWVIGVYLDPDGSVTRVFAGFPTHLFLTLVGVTLLFTQAHGNGTLDVVARAAVRLSGGNAGLIPIVFFVLTFALASSGAGNIAASALVSPMAMAVAVRARVPAFLMTIMVAHGALAGALSPFAPTGIIADEQLRRLGLGGHERGRFTSITSWPRRASLSPAISSSAASGCFAAARPGTSARPVRSPRRQRLRFTRGMR